MELLDYTEAAAFLRIAPQTLRKKKMAGKVPFVKPFGPNGRVFFLRGDLEALISSTRQPVSA